MVKKREIIAGLDIGTTKVCLVLAQLYNDNTLGIVGIGTSTSWGLQRGMVVDLESAVDSVKQALKKTKITTDIPIDSVYVGIAGAHIFSINNRGKITIEQEVKEEDITAVLEKAKNIDLPLDRKIIHVLPREFIIDGYGGVKDPTGMAGFSMEVEAHIITGASTAIENIAKSVKKAGLKIEEIVLQPVASAEAVLTQAEKELGVVLVDIGGGTTDIAIFHKGNIWHTAVLPLGGNHVTNDIAIGLRTSLLEAENLKIKYGHALSYLIDPREKIDVVSASQKEVRQVERTFLSEIIEARMEEIFSLIVGEVKKSGYKDYLAGGVVITGGASLLPGLTKLVEKKLGLPARLGIPEQVHSMLDEVNSPIYATAVGLIRYGFNYASCKEEEKQEETSSLLDNFWQKVKKWFSDFS